jgi:hypothetical protein
MTLGDMIGEHSGLRFGLGPRSPAYSSSLIGHSFAVGSRNDERRSKSATDIGSRTQR